MSGGCFNIKMHHGGSFSEDGALAYIGGEVSFFRNNDIDRMSYFELVEMARAVGFNHGDKLYYTIPGYDIEAGIDQIYSDQSVLKMLRHAIKADTPVDIYIQHGVKDNARTDAINEDVNMDEDVVRVEKTRDTRKIQKKRERRVWSAEEEALLIDLLYNISNSGWKVDTGHKSGYLTYIEKEMTKQMPNCGLKADPHIRSKVKILKKQLSYILDIQQFGSGFGWDDEKKMVTGDKDVFNEWAKSREGAAPLYMKPMVHYDKLCEIYANDLAKGMKAKGPGDHVNLNEDQSAMNETQGGSQFMDESAFQSQGSSTMTWKERKDSENKKVVSLGGKAPKKQRLPLSVARVMMKDQKEGEEKLLEQNPMLKCMGALPKRNNKPSEQKHKLEDMGLRPTQGCISNGVLDVKHLLRLSASSKNVDDKFSQQREENERCWTGKKKQGGKKKGGRKKH